MDEDTLRQTDRQTDKLTDRRRNRPTDGWNDGQTGVTSQTTGQTTFGTTMLHVSQYVIVPNTIVQSAHSVSSGIPCKYNTGKEGHQ